MPSSRTASRRSSQEAEEEVSAWDRRITQLVEMQNEVSEETMKEPQLLHWKRAAAMSEHSFANRSCGRQYVCNKQIVDLLDDAPASVDEPPRK